MTSPAAIPARNTARYCDGLERQFCIRFPGAGISGDRWAAVGGQTCLDPLDCVALTEDEARAAGETWARKRTTVIGADVSRLYRVEPLPTGWSNDGAPVEATASCQGNAPVEASAGPVEGMAGMVPQPCQPQQARARSRAPQPARGKRRYVTVRDTETGDVHRVLTSVARVGVAVVIFTPSNRHRQGALGGMLITHDDIRKAWVFNDEAEARRMLSRNGAPGERVIRAELIFDPAAA